MKYVRSECVMINLSRVQDIYKSDYQDREYKYAEYSIHFNYSIDEDNAVVLDHFPNLASLEEAWDKLAEFIASDTGGVLTL